MGVSLSLSLSLSIYIYIYGTMSFALVGNAAGVKLRGPSGAEAARASSTPCQIDNQSKQYRAQGSQGLFHPGRVACFCVIWPFVSFSLERGWALAFRDGANLIRQRGRGETRELDLDLDEDADLHEVWEAQDAIPKVLSPQS